MNTSKFYSAKSSARRAAKQAGLNPDAVEYVTENDQWAYVIPTTETVVEAPAVTEVPVSNTEEVFEDGPVRKEMTFTEAGDSVTVEDAALIQRWGTANCPHCNVHLTNGVLRHGHDEDGDGKIIQNETNEFWCMGCGEEFGPLLPKSAPKKEKGTGPSIQRVNESNVTNPCKLVWEIAIRMEGQPRKDVIAACVEAGVAYYTARTQYQSWYSARKAEKEAQKLREQKAAGTK